MIPPRHSSLHDLPLPNISGSKSGRIVFLGDCHLAPGQSAKAEIIERLLTSSAGATHVYILGDMFEIWTGPGSLKEKEFSGIFESLRRCAKAGTPVTFIRGNRDFLFGPVEKKSLGLAEVVDELVIDLEGERVFLIHGDLFCARDRHYQEYRRIVRMRPVAAVLRRIPRCLGVRAGRYLRRQSTSIVKHKGGRMTDLAPAALGEAFRRTGAGTIVCGHVHKSDERNITVDGRGVRVFILGAWEEAPREVLVYEKGSFSFESVS